MLAPLKRVLVRRLDASVGAAEAEIGLQETYMDSYSPTAVVIKISKVKLVVLLLIAICLVAGSILLWFIADNAAPSRTLRMKAVAIVGTIFFGLCGLYCLVKIFDTRPGLIIDDQGIIDNSSAVAAGRILWEEVVALDVSIISGQRIITIVVVDPQKYVRRGNVFTRMLNDANMKMMSSPINISSNSLNMKFDDLVQALTTAFERHKRTARTDRSC